MNESIEQLEQEARPNLEETTLFSIFPLIPNGKHPFKDFKWKPYQTRKPTPEELYTWESLFPNHNIAGIMGRVSGSIGIDLDSQYAIDSFHDRFGKQETAMYFTRPDRTRLQYIFQYPEQYDIRKQDKYLEQGNPNTKVEIKGNGSFMVIPNSIVNDYQRQWEIPPEIRIDPPADLLEWIITPGSKSPTKETVKRAIEKGNPATKQPGEYRYNGKPSCINQIFKRALQTDQDREISLHILYNLLINNRNPIQYAQSLIRRKNNENPIGEAEIRHIFNQPGYKNLGCNYVRNTLPYIDCLNCKCLTTEGKTMTKEFIMELSTEQKAILLMDKAGCSIRETAREMGLHTTQVVREKEKINKLLGIETPKPSKNAK